MVKTAERRARGRRPRLPGVSRRRAPRPARPRRLRAAQGHARSRLRRAQQGSTSSLPSRSSSRSSPPAAPRYAVRGDPCRSRRSAAENCDACSPSSWRAMPQRPPHFPRESLTDQPETFWVAEAIRGEDLPPDPPGGALRLRGPRRGDHRAQAPRMPLHPGEHLRRARLAEGHPDRQGTESRSSGSAPPARERPRALLRDQGIPRARGVGETRTGEQTTKALKEFGFLLTS